MNIVTINVRGLGNPQKCKTLFQWIEAKGFDIICLQGTFCTKDSVHKISKEWNGSSYHTVSDSSHSKGVSILMSNKFNHDVIDQHVTMAESY